MMTSGHAPSSVNLALVTPCHKRGSKDDPNNFRPIAVTHPLMRLYGLLNTRLIQYTEEHSLRAPSQAGFRPGHSVIHQICSLQHMVDKQKQAGLCRYICFLDLKSAYDRESRPVLWQVLQRLGLHGNMLQAIQGLYGSATVAVKINGQPRVASCVSIWGAAGLPAQSHIVWTPCRWLALFCAICGSC